MKGLPQFLLPQSKLPFLPDFPVISLFFFFCDEGLDQCGIILMVNTEHNGDHLDLIVEVISSVGGIHIVIESD